MRFSAMKFSALKCAVVLTALLPVAASLPGVRTLAQARAYQPPAGSAERKAIMDTLRKPVEKDLNRPVLFRVLSPSEFRAQNGWAFLNAQLRKPNGSPMDFRGTGYDGPLHSDEVCALLHRVGGHWRVVTLDMCATDVEWGNWSKKYHAPRAIFPPSG